jgi:hypothetical protein
VSVTSLAMCHCGEAYTRRVGVKGLSQGSVLSPLLYNVVLSGIDAQMVRGVSLLQYAEDLVIYASGFIVQRIRELLYCIVVMYFISKISSLRLFPVGTR